ncbi:regulatory protein RecX [Lysinibacter sp. HNR]|uniref:regulatory protein RecX n=1 Tax=Lysinibacter sp. HNR TaxID=3031408 RepID=UPI00243492A3|nr:regulatory protein RecX [Lysinibacter sp. HNR]WGD38278.1 regulatory protein RecX [Lysinibacter sp. HNR]
MAVRFEPINNSVAAVSALSGRSRRAEAAPRTRVAPEVSLESSSELPAQKRGGAKALARSRIQIVTPGFLAQGVETRESLSARIKDCALMKLAKKALSEREVRNVMIEAGADESLADDLLDEFRRRGYVNDVALAANLVETLMRRKKQGPAVIRRELSRRGIEQDAINVALNEVDEQDELQLVVSAAADRARRMGSIDRMVAERRLSGYLQRRGYSSDHIRIAVGQVLGNTRGKSHPVSFE